MSRLRLGSKRRRAAALVTVALACAGGVAVGRGWSAQPHAAASSQFAGTELHGAHVFDFQLRNQNGHAVRLSSFRGKVVLLTFLYTRCRDVCPLIATGLDDAVRDLGAKRRQVRILAVTVDPEGDTPAVARRYIASHRLGSQFEWLLGSHPELAPIWQNYNVEVEHRSIDKTAHAAPIFLLDQRGLPRVSYPPPQRRSDVEHDLKLLLGDA